LFQNANLLAELDKASSNVIFSKYIGFQESNLHPKNVYYDGTMVFWHKDILSHSIVQIALSIALHNLGNYEPALKETSQKPLFLT
jgi:hypothetical protein